MSPQRDDVQALTHRQTHNFRLFGTLFCEQFVLFSILQLVHQIHVLSINCILPLCPNTHTHTVAHSQHTHTHTHLCSSNAFLEWQKPSIIFCYLLLQMEPLFHDLAISRSSSLCICFYLFRPLPTSLSCPLLLSARLCLFRYVSLFFSPSFSPLSLPLHPCVQLLLQALFP